MGKYRRRIVGLLPGRSTIPGTTLERRQPLLKNRVQTLSVRYFAVPLNRVFEIFVVSDVLRTHGRKTRRSQSV